MTDLSKFNELNEQGKVPWEKRANLIHEQFPSVKEVDWNTAFSNDLDLFARVVKDILKADQAGPSRPGPRPSLDYGRASRRLHEMVADEFTHLPFTEALPLLAQGRSVRSIAAKTGLNRNHVHRVLTGKMDPDVYTMREVARAFGKKPQFFREYRQIYIVAAIMERLDQVPDADVNIYKKLKEVVNNERS